MSPRRPQRPVRRRSVALGVVCAAVALAALLGGIELLRHPLPAGTVILTEDAGDPRLAITCTEMPDEGVVRATSADLDDCARDHDGRTVRFQGEVIGAVLERGRGAWVQLNDDPYADTLGPLPVHRALRGGNSGVGALLDPSAVELIDGAGGPGVRGTVLEVVGTFHLVEPVSREVAVIVVDEARRIRPAEPFERTPLADRRLAALVLATLAAGAVVIERVIAARR